MKITIEGKDIVAAVVVAGCFTLMALGHNSLVTGILCAVVVTYLGIDISIMRRDRTELRDRRKENDEPRDTPGSG